MWKKLLFIMAIPSLAWSSPLKSHAVYDFSKGLDVYHSSLSLPDGFVQKSLNVLFDANAPISKRTGFNLVFSSSPYSFQTVWTYTDPTNTSWIIVRSSDELIANNLGGSQVLISTVSSNNLVGETNAFGLAYFVDQTQGVYSWNGTSTTYISGSPKGSLLAQWHSRLWVAGLAVPNGNLLYGSGYLNSSSWGTGVNPTDPVVETVGLQDNFDSLTALYPFLDTLYLFKHFLTYAEYGFDQTSFQISFITAECGCIDQQSIQTFNHGLDFVSERGLEYFDGYTCTRISDPLKPLLDAAIQSQGGAQTQSWVQSQVADWNSGTFNASTSLSSSINSPSLVLTSTNTTPSDYGLTTTAGSVGVGVSGLIELSTVSISGGESLSAQAVSAAGLVMAPSIWMQGSFKYIKTGGFSAAALLFTNQQINSGWGIQEYYTGSGTICGGRVGTLSNNSASLILSDVCSSVTATQLNNVDLYASSTGYLQLYINGSLKGTNTVTPQVSTPSFVSMYMNDQGTAKVVPGPSWETNGFTVTSSSGVLTTQSHNMSGISSFGNFSSNNTLNGGTLSFAVCTAASSNMSGEVCKTQTPNSQISVATNTYVDWIATFSVTSATQTPVLQSGTVQWFTGNRSPSMASTIWDNRYWLSLTTSTVDSNNDAIIVLGIKGSLSLLDIHAGGITQYKNSLYHSDSLATGNVYLDNQGYMDNGVAINAFIQTKDYCQEGPPQDDYYESIYPSADNLGNYNINISYTMDRTTTFSLSSVNQSEFSNNTSIKVPFILNSTNQNFGKCINYTFQESDPNSPWSFFGFTDYFHERAVQ